MGGGGGDQTTTTEPWDGVRPYLRDLYAQAYDAFQNSDPRAFGGSLNAGASDATLAAQQGQLQLAAQLGGVGNSAIDLGQRTLGGEFLDINNNPYTQAAISAAIDPSVQAVQEQIIPQLQSAAVGSGAYGGSREAVLQGQVAGQLARETQNTAAQMAGDFYNQERRMQQLAPELINQGIGQNQVPIQLLSQLGQNQEGYTQAALQEQFRQHQAQAGAPFNFLQEYANILNGGSGGFGVSTTSGGGPGGAQQFLSGGLGTAGTVGALGMAAGASGGTLIPLMLAGGLLGGGLSMF